MVDVYPIGSLHVCDEFSGARHRQALSRLVTASVQRRVFRDNARRYSIANSILNFYSRVTTVNCRLKYMSKCVNSLQ